MASVTSNPSTAGTLANRAQGLLTIRIEPPRKCFELRLKELWTYRELLCFLGWREVRARYKQTAIGVCTFHQNHDYGYHPEEGFVRALAPKGADAYGLDFSRAALRIGYERSLKFRGAHTVFLGMHTG